MWVAITAVCYALFLLSLRLPSETVAYWKVGLNRHRPTLVSQHVLYRLGAIASRLVYVRMSAIRRKRRLRNNNRCGLRNCHVQIECTLCTYSYDTVLCWQVDLTYCQHPSGDNEALYIPNFAKVIGEKTSF